VSDPSTETWRAALGQSTSAQLRQTQAALAASQADLTRVERERNDLAGELHILKNSESAALAAVEAERDALALLNAELKAEAAHWRAANEKEGTS
jgi:outer membrane protein TolC